jgi:hypothetical protein
MNKKDARLRTWQLFITGLVFSAGGLAAGMIALYDNEPLVVLLALCMHDLGIIFAAANFP